MTLDRRTLLALPLAVGVAPAAFAQGRVVPPSEIPTWPPAESFPVWPALPPGAPSPLPRYAPEITGRPGTYRDIFMRGTARPDVGVFRPARPDGRSVLVMPGGGYGFVSLRGEGMDVARALNPMGITVFVLNYRLPGEGWADRANVPLADAQRAMRLIRVNAPHYGIRPEHIGVLGFSAGGHLAGSLIVHHELRTYVPIDAADRISARPGFAGLFYAVASMEPGASHGQSRGNLLGRVPEAGMEARYTIGRHLKSGSAPLFLVHAEDDGLVPVANTIDLRAAARRAGVSAETLILDHGGHGFGARLPASSPGSLWPHLFDRWIGETIGMPHR